MYIHIQYIYIRKNFIFIYHSLSKNEKKIKVGPSLLFIFFFFPIILFLFLSIFFSLLFYHTLAKQYPPANKTIWRNISWQCQVDGWKTMLCNPFVSYSLLYFLFILFHMFIQRIHYVLYFSTPYSILFPYGICVPCP